VLCFSLGSRVRGNDGWVAGMTVCWRCASPCPLLKEGVRMMGFVFLWIPASAGMTAETPCDTLR